MSHRNVVGRSRLVHAPSGFELESRTLLSATTHSGAADVIRAERADRVIVQLEHRLAAVQAASATFQAEHHRTPVALARIAERLRTRLARLAPPEVSGTPTPSPSPSPSPSTSAAGSQDGTADPGPSAQSNGSAATTPLPVTGGSAGQAATAATITVLAQFDNSFPQAPASDQPAVSYAWDLSDAPDAMVLNGLGTDSLEIYWHDPNTAGATAADSPLGRDETVTVTETLSDGSRLTATFSYNVIYRVNPLWEPGMIAQMGGTGSGVPVGLTPPPAGEPQL